LIEFETWFPQIVGYARLISDGDTLRRSWLHGDRTETSVTDFDELWEQVFDDLDSDTLEKQMVAKINDNNLRDLTTQFLARLRYVESAVRSGSALQEPTSLLGSPQWALLETTAAELARASSGHDISAA
jgi:hypothetical protein